MQKRKHVKIVRVQNQSFLTTAFFFLSLVFRQCENLPPALALSCHKNSVHSVSKETIRIPMGTSVFLPWQYAVGYSQSEISFCVIHASTAWEFKVRYFTDKHSSNQDNMKRNHILKYKHRTSELCTYIKQHRQVPNDSKTPDEQFFPKHFLCSTLCSDSLRDISKSE